ncbi:hypothetical protein BRARA_K01385 [Brassica rapa]|uniref:Uncharacterized protein n=1 Tax=Brassica campestris TaxID=3711 RepID=A0A397L4V9_BRACM|nr:hypothetical protein BRARA_K01385 [Brassica rapa]
MARDQEGRINTAKTATLQKIMESRIRDQQEHDEHMQKRMRQSSPRRYQKLEPKPPDFVQYGSSKNRRFKEEDAGRRREPHLKQPASTWSRSHQTSRNFKSDDHFSYNQTMAKPKIYVFTGEGDYLKWERTVTKWLCYNRILKKDALAYVMSQLKGNVYKWLLQEEDDRMYYREPAITTWEDLNGVEPLSATSIQGDQAKESSAAIQKDEQPVQNVMVPFKQAIVPEETPREPQTACKKRQLIVFDPYQSSRVFKTRTGHGTCCI